MRRTASQENPSEDVAADTETNVSDEARLDAADQSPDDGSDNVTVDDLAPDLNHVQYIGRASERQIDAGTWPDGCDQDMSAVWGFFNDFKIDKSKFTEDQLEYLLGDLDGSFVLVE